MAQISTQLAIELIEAHGQEEADGNQYIDTEIGYSHELMRVEQATRLINAADGVFLRDDYLRKRPYRLMAISKEGSVIRFEVDE